MANQQLLPVAVAEGDAGDPEQHHNGNHQPAICTGRGGFHPVSVFVQFVVLLHFLPPQTISRFPGGQCDDSGAWHCHKQLSDTRRPTRIHVVRRISSKRVAELGVSAASLRYGISTKSKTAKQVGAKEGSTSPGIFSLIAG